MAEQCAFFAQSSTGQCAIYSQDIVLVGVQDAHMAENWLQARHKFLKQSQTSLQNVLGKERSTISRKFGKPEMLKVKELPAVAEALQVTVYDLLVGIGLLDGQVPPDKAPTITLNEDALGEILDAALNPGPVARHSEEEIQNLVGVVRSLSKKVADNPNLLKGSGFLRGYTSGALEHTISPPRSET